MYGFISTFLYQKRWLLQQFYELFDFLPFFPFRFTLTISSFLVYLVGEYILFHLDGWFSEVKDSSQWNWQPPMQHWWTSHEEHWWWTCLTFLTYLVRYHFYSFIYCIHSFFLYSLRHLHNKGGGGVIQTKLNQCELEVMDLNPLKFAFVKEIKTG